MRDMDHQWTRQEEVRSHGDVDMEKTVESQLDRKVM